MPVRASSKIQSAGLLLFRQRDKSVQVLLGHPGGPFWSRKDQGAWTIPKGLIGPGESLLSAAQREFAEETGYRPGGEAIPLGSAKQPGGKIVHVWAIEEDWDPADHVRDGMASTVWATAIISRDRSRVLVWHCRRAT